MSTEFLHVDGVSKFFGGLKACNNVTMTLNKGEIVGLIGPNGAGKTTLLNVIAGAYRPTAGVVRFKGHQTSGLKPSRICALGVARTHQIVKPFGNLTVYRNIEVGAFLRTGSPKLLREKVEEVLAFTGLQALRNHVAKDLPVGIRKRLEIARALATGPELLLLDEAMAGLNPAELDGAIDLVHRIQASGVTLLVIEHLMKVILSISHRLVVLAEGAIIAQGPPKDVCRDLAVVRAYLGDSYARDQGA